MKTSWSHPWRAYTELLVPTKGVAADTNRFFTSSGHDSPSTRGTAVGLDALHAPALTVDDQQAQYALAG